MAFELTFVTSPPTPWSATSVTERPGQPVETGEVLVRFGG
jgi:hypothetical protein